MIPDTDPPRTLGDKAAYGLLKVDCPEICNQAFLRLIRCAGSKTNIVPPSDGKQYMLPLRTRARTSDERMLF